MSVNKSIKLLTILSMGLLLAACQKHDENYYLTHPSKIGAPYKRCINQSALSAPMAGQCVVVIKAADKVRTLFMALIKNQQVFGLALLHEQTRLGEYQTKLAKNQKILTNAKRNQDSKSFVAGVKKQIEYLEKQIATQKVEIKSRIAFIRLLTKRME